jgi:hypothetical protein
MMRLCASGLALLVAMAVSAWGSSSLTNVAPAKPDPGIVPPPGTLQGGDTIETANTIPALPFFTTGTTAGYNDDYDETCPYGGSTSPDVVYRWTADFTGCVDIHTCESGYDTKLYVYESFYTPGAYHACNDDNASCSGPAYRSWIQQMLVTEGSIYYIVVDGYGGDFGDYLFSMYEVSDCPYPCYPSDCMTGGIPEDEPLCFEWTEDSWNGGCNVEPPVFDPVDPYTIICGHSGNYSYGGTDYRDMDWYELHTYQDIDLSFCVCAEFPVRIWIVEGNHGCSDPYTIATDASEGYTAIRLDYSLPSGVYWLIVSVDGWLGVPCDAEYIAVIWDGEPPPFPLPQTEPVAVIDNISPNPAEEGEPVTFQGHGEPPSGGSIVAYEWASSVDGLLSDEPSFSTPDLAHGAHTIELRVQDNGGEWSDADSTLLWVGQVFSVAWTSPRVSFGEYTYDERAWLGDRSTISLRAQNTCPVDAEFLYGLSEDWVTDVPGQESSAWLSGSPYSWDMQSAPIDAGEIRSYQFEVWNHWDWIHPWDIRNVIGIILTILPGVGEFAGAFSTWSGAVGALHWTGNYSIVIGASLVLMEPLGLHVCADIDYGGLGHSQNGTPFTVTNVVSPDKLVLYVESIFLMLPAGLASCVPNPITWVIEAGLIIGCQVMYVAAYDPDMSYDELVDPEFFYPPELDTIEEPEAREMVHQLFTGVGYLQALSTSFIRYQGALLDGSEDWAAMQLAAVRLYSERASECLEPLPDFMEDISVPPSQAQIDSMRAAFLEEGLPELEQSVLAQFGFSQDEIDQLGADMATVPDEVYYEVGQVPALLRTAVSYLDSLPLFSPELPGQAMVGELGADPDTIYRDEVPTAVTCWVEFPGIDDLNGYQIISATLNDEVQAIGIADAPSDYDGDGNPDFSMTFDPGLLVDDWQDGEHLAWVSGTLLSPSPDTLLYTAATTIIVLGSASPVDGYIYGELAETGSVVLRWEVGSLDGIRGFHVYRATAAEGPFVRVTERPIPISQSYEYEDATVWPETTFWYQVRAILPDGAEDVIGPGLVSVWTGGRLELKLHPPHPNPFGQSSTVQFDTPSPAGHVSVAVYNVRGQLVKRLVDEPFERGRHTAVWNGRDESGRLVSSGAYFVRLEADGQVRQEKLFLVR